MILHITNGDSAGGKLKKLFAHDTVLPWRDPLHDGPAPAGLTLADFSAVRAAYLAESCQRPASEIQAEFAERDATLARFQEFSETVLWFEHDLYDQLQLLQILDWFHSRRANLTLIQSSTHLGPLSLHQLLDLFPGRLPVTREQIELATVAWHAFCSPDPRALESFLEQDERLPFLASAFERLCEEFPWLDDGLTRTERVIEQLKDSGITDPQELFREYRRTENPEWMGDSSFFAILNGARHRPAGWRWDPTRRRLARHPS